MAQYDFDLREYWRIVKKKKFIIAFTTVAMGLFSLIFAMIASPPPFYKTTASVKFERTSLASGLYLQTVSMSPGDDMQTQMAIIKSYYIIELVAKKLGLIPENLTSDEIRNNQKYISIINRLKVTIETEQEAQSSLINITVTSEDPKFAQRIANTVVSVYKDQRTLELNKRTIDARKFVEEQLKGAKEKLKNSENGVRDFREKNKLISIESQSGALMSQLTAYKTSYERILADTMRIESVKMQLDEVESKPLTSKTSFYLDEASPGYRALNDRLVQLLMDRDALLITYTDNYPQVVEIKKRIHEIVQNMLAQLKAQLRSLGETGRNLKKKIEETDYKVRNLPELGLELARLERNVRVDTEVYSLLEKSYQESLIKEAEKVEDVQIVRPALEPTTPMNPPKTKATAGIGTLLGLILGVVFAFLIETFDTSIGTIEEVENFLGVPVLGVVPHITEKDIKASLYQKYAGTVDEDIAERTSRRLLSHFAPQSTLAESYRAFRTNLSFACRDANIRSIAFTSATPREGKTTSIVNLAITVAQTGHRVLLVEADLRKPVIAHMFGIDQTPGLTDALLGNFEWEKSVRTIADIMMGKLNIDEVLETPGMDNLHIIPAGTIPPNPAELINSHSINHFLEWAKSNYDMVLLDAPPILAATDAALLGSKTDAVVIVYRVGKISRVTLRRAKQQLENVRAKVLGVVLNGIKADISPDFADYDYKYYHYYGGAERKQTLLDKIKNFPVHSWDSMKKRFKKDGKARSEQVEEDGGKHEERREKKIPARKTSGWRVFVLLTALAASAGGAAWQTGYLRADYLKFLYARVQTHNPFMEKNRVKTKGIKRTISRTNGQASAIRPQPSVAVQQVSSVKSPSASPADSTPAVAVPSGKAPASELMEKPFSIQVKALRNDEAAGRFVQSLRSEGVDAYTLKVELKDRGIWHRIFIGHFTSNEEAHRYIEENRFGDKYPGSLVRKVSVLVSVSVNRETR